MRHDTAVIIPVYNEAKVIKRVIGSVKKYFSIVICVDDGSDDESCKEIQAAGAILIRHPINMGQGAALQTGLEYARGVPEAAIFVTFDADGQHRVADVTRMILELQKGEADIIFGSRFMGRKAIDMPLSKRIILRAAIVFSNLTSGLRLTDTHNGLRVFNRLVADNLTITISDMAHASEILEIVADK